jgi:hypothetical protein
MSTLRNLKLKGVYFMDVFKKTIGTASLIAVFLFAILFSASAAENSVGSGNDDWWTIYPKQSTAAGTDVNHPAWVLDALEKKPVLIYVHKDCSYCAPQTAAVNNVSDEFKGDITYYEIKADGSDSRAEEALQAYDPNGGVSYVPMTIIVTLAPDSEGNVMPVWHSNEDLTGDDWIKNYVEDAISYYDENSSNWKK